jgi:serine/threonine protein kinase
MMTDKAVYNLLPSNYKKCKRRIPFSLVGSVTVSGHPSSNEFVVHVPAEYDYRFISLRRRDLLKSMRRCCAANGDTQPLRVNQSSRHDLRGLCVTKSMSKKQRKLVQMTVDELRVLDPEQDDGAGAPRSASDTSELIEAEAMLLKTTLGQACPTNDHQPPMAPDSGRTRGWSCAAPPVTLKDFKLDKVIGRGSFGKVYLVQKNTGADRGEFYALKELKKQAIIERNQVEHTKAEREIMEKIDFPFLMKLHYAFQTDTKLYFVMDYLPGGELFFHLKNEHRLDESRARFYAAEIALGIGHLHAKAIIYRDLKPENILLDRDGHVRMTDFGLSKGNMGAGATTMTFCGTPEYLAPEIVKGDPHDKEVDWWSLGILIYEMLAGVPPFYSDNVHLMYRLIETSPVRFPPRMSGTVRDLIVKLLHRDPKQRLGSARDLEEIKAHAWFAGLDWDKLAAKQLSPPFKPAVKGEADVSNVDACFTQEAVPVKEEAETAEEKAAAKAADFSGFSYAPKAGTNPKRR